MSHRISTKVFVVVAVLVALALAGGVSYYASSSPDGLNKVAADHGFDAKQRDSAAADSPMSGYDTKGVNDSRVSGGLAGVAGVAVVLLATGALTYLVRRRPASAPDGG